MSQTKFGSSYGLMRADPFVEERGTPHYMVPASPKCQQEISLLTLPVFQGSVVSSEHLSQSLLPGNVVELRGSPPLWGSLEQLERPFPASPPLQGTKLATLSTPEASLERLVPLLDLFDCVETTAKCVSMDYVHCRTRLSWHSAAAFQRGHSHAGGSRAGSGNGTRSEHSPEEGGHRGGPSSRQLFRVLQLYFIVPGKGVASFLDLIQLNRSVIRLKFRKLSSSRSCLTPDPRTGGHERSIRLILLPYHRKFLRCALGAKRINIRFFPSNLHSRPD